MSVEHGWEQEMIALKELLLIVLAVAIWGHKWADVMTRCEYMSVVEILSPEPAGTQRLWILHAAFTFHCHMRY